ncbi:hypothetical protein, unlikely [Trypanosoma congolense IL3000]|uniref:Uncharacterized protein n=1 Tax=Trypanosoma congolense (strain IL3000) TaxID=1068625 RepID=F9WD32_TRYCI|nr:hypothetical protein, unlikely [Trypanosoma congolense IL3000]
MHQLEESRSPGRLFAFPFRLRLCFLPAVYLALYGGGNIISPLYFATDVQQFQYGGSRDTRGVILLAKHSAFQRRVSASPLLCGFTLLNYHPVASAKVRHGVYELYNEKNPLRCTTHAATVMGLGFRDCCVGSGC